MTAPHHSRFVAFLDRLPLLAAAVAGVVAAMVLAGWQWNVAAMKSVLPGLVAMNPLTAVTFVLAGVSLLALRADPGRRGVGVCGYALAAAVTLVGLAKLSDLAVGSTFGLDQVLFRAKLPQSVGLPPNRMAPNTALTFLLVGLSLLTLRADVRRGHRPSQYIALVAAGFSLLAILGYWLNADQLYGLKTYIPMALNTALTFAMISIAILFAHPGRGVTRVFVADDAGGSMARHVMPFAVLVPALLAWIRVRAQRLGLMAAELSVPAMIFACIVLLTGFLWVMAARLSRADQERLRARAELQRAHDQLEERVRERTAELEDTNERLRREVDDRVRADAALRDSEARFLQSQKMEAVGLLAGGVAHDFNNLLTAIMGYGQLMRRKLKPGDPVLRDSDEILKASERAAALTRQLLAFSRQQVLEPRILDLNAVVMNMHQMLRRLIGEDIDLATSTAADLGRVKADPGQLEQVMMNLVVNARDAMPRGGKLTIETANVDLSEGYAKSRLDLEPGRYVMLAVSDNGTGMSPETAARIFDPFFTTKEMGRGTGLGLSTVHGIIKQSDGHIEVYSEQGQGTTFKIYLPRAEGKAEVAQELRPADHIEGTETLLLVEDEEVIRRVMRESLELLGYTVLEAGDGSEAVRICERRDQPIHLMVTDVVMPLMSGPELAQRVSGIRPDLRILLVSGYTDRALVHQGRNVGTAFLQKPFTPDALAKKIREILDGPREQAA